MNKKLIASSIIGLAIVIGIVATVTVINTQKKPMAMGMQTAAKVDTSGAVATDSVSIKNFAFSPSVITVKAGTTVTWKNYDAIRHSVTSDDGSAMTFDSGLIDSQATTTVTFDKPGTYQYHCTPHPYMKAFVVVTAA